MASELLVAGRLTFRSLADPLPLFLAVGHLIKGASRGLLYWNLRPPLIHLAFVTSVVSLGFLALFWQKIRSTGRLDLVRLALVAVGFPILAAGIVNIDHPVVALYYLFSAALSIGWTLFLSRQLNRILAKIGYDGMNR